MGPNTVIDVSTADGHLMAMLHGFPFHDLGVAPVAAYASSPTDFRIDGRFGTTLSFKLDSDGLASGLTIDSGRWAQVGIRIPK